jgi:hypothetical protein
VIHLALALAGLLAAPPGPVAPVIAQLAPWQSIPNCIVALEGDLGVTSVAGKVSAWKDQSGNNNSAFQATAGLQPSTGTAINSQATVHFGGTVAMQLSSVGLTTSSTETVYLVAKLSSTPSSTNAYTPLIFIGSDASSTIVSWRNQAGRQNFDFISGQSATVALVGWNPTLDTSAHAWAWEYRGGGVSTPGNYTTWLDGTTHTLTASGSLAMQSPGAIGAIITNSDTISANAFSGDLGLVLIFSRAVTALEIQEIETYVKAKYGSGL